MESQKHIHVYRASSGFFCFVKLIIYFIITKPMKISVESTWDRISFTNLYRFICGIVCWCYNEISTAFLIMDLVSGERVQKLHNTECNKSASEALKTE
jgi:aminoglycoside phosphotransferase